MKYVLYILIFFSTFSIAIAQEDEKDKYANADKSTPDFLLEQDTIFVSKKKKKKRKKKTFNKLKTKRGFTTRGSGRGRTDELLFYLKKYKAPSKYVSPIYVYDVKKLRLVKLKKYDIKKYPADQFKIPHGPYTKKKGDILLEEGYFWIGTLHHNWFSYIGEQMIVKSRRSYHKGFPENYKIIYYDPVDQTEVKEIIPFDEYERNSGVYKFYYENGRIKTIGKYIEGVKTGKWYEYYSNGLKKIETQFTLNSETKKLESKVLNEWNSNGKLKEEYLKKKKEKEKKKYNKIKY